MKQHWEWIKEAIKNPASECVIWPFKSVVRRNGGIYGRCNYGAQVLAHRLSFFFVNGRWPTPCARHTCDNTLCINPKHIVEGTQADNIADMVKRGRTSRGEDRPESKMTDALVRKIRSEYIPWKNGTAKLGRKYGLDRKNIYNIVTGRAWKHIQ